MKQDNVAVLREFLHKYKNIELPPVTPETTLEELKIDSLMLLELLFEFEDKLGVKIPNDVPQPKTVGELLGIIEGLKTAKDG